MKTLQRATPCVGICSTTYGDLVCRGCKRYAHEIVQWNGYDEAQRGTVWRRLFELRAETVQTAVQVTDQARFDAAVKRFDLPADEPWAVLAYELLRRVVRKDQPIEAFGLTARDESQDTLTLLRNIDADIYNRALAHYEHSYRVSAR